MSYELCQNDRGEFKLFVKNLPWSADDNMLYETFGECGEVCYGRVCTEQETGRSRGFGFVCYYTKEEAQAAIDKLNGKYLDGREITVRAATDRRQMGAAGSPAGAPARNNACFAFQKGDCSRGDSCKFAHEGETAAAPVVEKKTSNNKIVFGDDDNEEEEKSAEEKVESKKRKADASDGVASSPKKAKKEKWIKVCKKALKKADGGSLKIKELVAVLSKKGIEMEKKALKKCLKKDGLFDLNKKVVSLAA